MDKLKKKKLLIFLLGISLIAFLFGTFFITILSKSDQALTKEYITSFMKDIYTNNIDYIPVLKESLVSNILFVCVIWLLGISVIGIPIILFMYFFKAFTLGFAITSFVLTYKTKGIIFSILYIFPNEILKFGSYTLLVMYSIKVSKKLIESVIKKENIVFNKIFNKYIKVLGIVVATIILCCLYETFIIPFIFNKLYFIIK